MTTRRLVLATPLFTLLVAAPAGPPAAAPAFTRLDVPVDGSPRRLAAADLDGDGDVDLALEAVSGTLSRQLVLLNDGAQTFTPGWSATLSTDGFPGVADLDLGDVNGDGYPDLVLQIPLHNSLLRLNNGDGSFSAPSALPVPNVPDQQSLGDLDADGDLDLAYYLLDFVGYAGTLPGDGQGAFGNGFDLPCSPITAAIQSTTLGDVTADGQPDFVLPAPNGLFALRGQATPFPLWALPSLLLAPGGHRDAAFADLDGNGWSDVVATRPSGGVTVVLVDAAGPGAPQSFDAGLAPEALALADFDGDGHADAAVTNARGTITVLSGDGDGALLPTFHVKAGRTFVALAAADLDGDGDVDLAAADATGNSIVLLFNLLVP